MAELEILPLAVCVAPAGKLLGACFTKRYNKEKVRNHHNKVSSVMRKWPSKIYTNNNNMQKYGLCTAQRLWVV